MFTKRKNINNATGTEVVELLNSSIFHFTPVGRVYDNINTGQYYDLYYTKYDNKKWLNENGFKRLTESDRYIIKQNVMIYLCDNVDLEDRIYDFLDENKEYYDKAFKDILFSEFRNKMDELRTMFRAVKSFPK